MNNDKKETTIYSTKEYDKFKLYEWNREINKGILKKIHKSVMKCGWRQEPIVVDANYGIIDGQHRYTYAKQHNLPVFYFIADGATQGDCQRMNSVRLGWKATDFIKFYATLGNKDFMNLSELLEMFSGFNLGTIAYAIIGASPTGGLSTKIIDGTFECNDESYLKAVESLSYLKNLEYYIQKIKGRKTQLCQAIIFCYWLDGIDRDRLARRIAETYNSINPPTDMERALEELEFIYNYKIGKFNRVFIVTEWRKGR